MKQHGSAICQVTRAKHAIFRLALGFCCFSLLGALPGEPVSFPFLEPIDPPRAVQIMAHRGMAEQTPENTAPALEHCIADGIEWAEIDLRQTRDGAHVLLHDSRLDRTTDGKGDVKDIDLGELRKRDAGLWFAERFRGTKILTLSEALRLAKGRLNLYLDCKSVDPASLIREIKEEGMEKQVLIYGPEDLVEKIHSIGGLAIPKMTKWRPSYGIGEWLDRVQPTAVEVDADDVAEDRVQALHKRGIKVEAKALGDHDQPEAWRKLIKCGVDWIQTDHPVEFLSVQLRERRPKLPVQIALHRAASRYAPENTIAAIDRAIRLDADYVEIDVRTSRNGKFYLQHDSSWNRRTTGRGNVRDTDSSAIKDFDAGSWFGKPFVKQPVPSLEEALDRLQGKADVYFDAKDIEPEALARILRTRQLLEHVVVFQGVEYLKKLKAIEPTVRAMPPLSDPKQVDRLVETLHPYAFDTKWTILSKELIEHCHEKNVKVFSDSLGLHENVASFRRAIDWGIDVIQTDHPARLFRALELTSGGP